MMLGWLLMLLVLLLMLLSSRFDGPKLYPQYWTVMRDSFDLAMCAQWELSRGKGLLRHHFVQANNDCLALLMDIVDVRSATLALKTNAELSSDTIGRLMKSSTTGRKLFDDCAVKMDFQNFLQNIEKRLNDLEHADFGKDEVVDFKGIMNRTTSAMKHHGQKYFDKKTSKLGLLGATVELSLSCLDDEWSFRLAGRIKTVAVNVGLVPLLPWETLMLENGKLRGVRENCPISEDMLKDITNCREACLNFLGNGMLSLGDMRRICNHHSKTLLALDRTFALDLQFLNQEAEQVISSSVRQDVLDCLPSQVLRMKPETTLARLEIIKGGHRTMACGPRLESEVAGIIAIAHSISQGLCPTRAMSNQMSPFYISALKLMENFCELVDVNEDAKVTVLVGPKAIVALYNMMNQHDGIDGKTLKDAMVFRTFRWMLSGEQQIVADGWIQTIVRQQLGPGVVKEITNGEEATPNNKALAVVLLGSSSRSSASSSCPAPVGAASAMIAGAKKMPVKGAKASKDVARATTRDNLMKFFSAKK
jgi:hypothetical protein